MYPTAIRTFEPSLTERDFFIGLNSEGRLINVEEERTSMYDDGSMPYSPVIKQVPQELLPLSMFLRAMGGSVKVHRRAILLSQPTPLSSPLLHNK